ncbi:MULTISPECIES: hypothetical protein [Croceicoccus]|uniref:Uncharacterized protein n=1 Tax=Croceicoccus naphthovorans TaxID=1348774 RepID=A0A0G3XFH9_9SPHN|nr:MULTISPECIES: hypothetical protein [Croceicoccus]AKM09396.1 hypothetical protein AB433_04390 [Croceicoccus naphthovorans]MBB3990326.1 hypothetical protein [Croceicoccus naphthovorans]
MTHEYDDPIDPEQLTQAVRHIAERYRAEDCELSDLIDEVVDERFCGCVASRQDSTDRPVRDGLVAEIARQVRQLLNDGLFDEVDEASIESFPASDPPAWINRGSKGGR